MIKKLLFVTLAVFFVGNDAVGKGFSIKPSQVDTKDLALQFSAACVALQGVDINTSVLFRKTLQDDSLQAKRINIAYARKNLGIYLEQTKKCMLGIKLYFRKYESEVEECEIAHSLGFGWEETYSKLKQTSNEMDFLLYERIARMTTFIQLVDEYLKNIDQLEEQIEKL